MLLGELWRPEDSMMPALLSSPVVGDSILIVRPWDLRLLFSTWAWPRLPAEPCGRVLYSDRHRSVWSPNECFLGFTVFVEFLLVLCSSFSIEIFFRLFEPFTATVYIKKDWIGAKYYRKGSGERYFIILIDISLNLPQPEFFLCLYFFVTRECESTRAADETWTLSYHCLYLCGSVGPSWAWFAWPPPQQPQPQQSRGPPHPSPGMINQAISSALRIWFIKRPEQDFLFWSFQTWLRIWQLIIPCLVVPRSLLTLHPSSLTLTVVNMMICRSWSEGVREWGASLTRVNVGKLSLVVRLVIQTPGGLGASQL